MAVFALLAAGASAQTTMSRKEAREARKQQQEAIDLVQHEKALQALKDSSFVLKADRVIFRRGRMVSVSSTTNFVSRYGNRATVQIAFDFASAGPNGLGGITVEGHVSEVSVKTDKKGFTYYRMNVMGVGISATVDITLFPASNRASVTVYPNYNSNTLTLEGVLEPTGASHIFKGSSL